MQAGRTPLHEAIQEGHDTIVAALIFAGAPLDVQDSVRPKFLLARSFFSRYADPATSLAVGEHPAP